MRGAFRLDAGGRIDRGRQLGFTFDGRRLTGYAGDTVASALIASRVAPVARSFKLHRPRGIVGAGYEDMGALLARTHPRPATNLPATMTPLEPGAVYTSVNAFPSARFDLGAVVQPFARLLPAGFYYKTFMWPSWHLFEPLVRRAAGLGAVPLGEAWQPVSETRHGQCDVLVAGGGAAGLAAALAAGRAGARVVLADDGLEPGGRLGADGRTLDGRPALAWAVDVLGELAAMPNVRVLARSTVWGAQEHGLLTVLERAPRDCRGLDFRQWKIRARQIIVATGAIERPIAFADNDRPGVMLASAVAAYLNRHGVAAGRRAVIYTTTDAAYVVGAALARAGAEVTLVDARDAPDAGALQAARAAGCQCRQRAHVVRAHGRRAVKGVTVRTGEGRLEQLDCDLVATSGGFNPAIHLASHTRRADIAWDEALGSFRARSRDPALRLAGAANGRLGLAQCLADGAAAGLDAARAAGREGAALDLPAAEDEPSGIGPPIWVAPAAERAGKVFIDLMGDVTTRDLKLAVREGYDSIELVKRYTTAGMGSDQGKTGNVTVIGIVGGLKDTRPDAVGTTTFRPPYVPVEFGAIAGERTGARLYPWRHTPLTEWHLAHGAVMYEAGLRWQRPGYYARAGEDWLAAATREARAVREGVGVYDGSPLGKFQLKGSGVPELVDLLYVSDMGGLKPGRGRYSVMLSDDGLFLDDGVLFRLDAARWLLHTSTGAADRVHQHIEQVLNLHRPDLAVTVIPMTSQWANATLCGPRARAVLAALAPDFDLAPEAFRFMDVREGRVAGLPARVFRVSWTGEQSFEINVRARDAQALWERIMEAGRPFAIAAVGSEANHILRVEAGYISSGHEVDGTADVIDLGLGALVSKRKRDFLGKRSLAIRRRAEPRRLELVGFLPEDAERVVPDGAPITQGGARTDQEGFVSACVRSVALGRTIALGLLADGRGRIGERVHARVFDEVIGLTVTAPVFHDADRARVRS